MRTLRASLVVVLAVAAFGLARPAPAHACTITPVGNGQFGCFFSGALDPACPAAGVMGTYSYFFNIPTWGRSPTFSASGPSGSFLDGHSPCPNSTVSDVSGTDNAPGGSPGAGERAFEIDFTVTGNGGASGGQTPNVDLSVQYAGAPAACISPQGADFDGVEVGEKVSRRFTVTNCGHAPLVIDHLEQVGGAPAFTIRADLCAGATIPPGGSCTFDVDFAPTEDRLRTATIKVVDNAGDSPQSIQIQGTGLAPVGGGGGGGGPQPADVYISRFVEKGIRREGDHQIAVTEVQVTNRGPGRATGFIEAQTALLGSDGAAAPVRIAYDLGPGETLTQPAEARIISDDAFTLTVRVIPTTPDPDLSNNGPRIATFRPPKSSIKTASPGFFSGVATALGDLIGLFALPEQDRITRVDLAVRRLGGAPGTCRWLRDRRAHFRTVDAQHGRCTPSPAWLRAKGTTRWHLRLARALPPGRYVLLSRATDSSGLRQLGFARRAFRVDRRAG
jgi:hypothetical protein